MKLRLSWMEAIGRASKKKTEKKTYFNKNSDKIWILSLCSARVQSWELRLSRKSSCESIADRITPQNDLRILKEVVKGKQLE